MLKYLWTVTEDLFVVVTLVTWIHAVLGRLYGEYVGNLLGDKANTVLFDNTKIKRFVPGYQATVPFVEGVRRAYEYFLAHPELQTIDEEWDKNIEAILEADRAFYPKK